MQPILIAPSVLSADFTRLGEEVRAVVLLQRAIDVTRRAPFQQASAGDQHPPDRAHDRIEAEERFVGEERECEQRLHQVPPRGAVDGRQMLPERYLVRLVGQIG